MRLVFLIAGIIVLLGAAFAEAVADHPTHLFAWQCLGLALAFASLLPLDDRLRRP